MLGHFHTMCWNRPPFPPVQCWLESSCQQRCSYPQHWLVGGGEGWGFNKSSCIMLKVVRNNSTKKNVNGVQNRKKKMDFVPTHFFQDCLSEVQNILSKYGFWLITWQFLQIISPKLAQIIWMTLCYGSMKTMKKYCRMREWSANITCYHTLYSS